MATKIYTSVWFDHHGICSIKNYNKDTLSCILHRRQVEDDGRIKKIPRNCHLYTNSMGVYSYFTSYALITHPLWYSTTSWNNNVNWEIAPVVFAYI